MLNSKITLGEICKIEKGKIGIQAAIPGKYPLVTTGEKRSSHNEYHFEGEAVCIPLVSATGHGHASIKRLQYQSGKFCVGSILAVCIPKNSEIYSAKFLYLYLSSFKDSVLVPLMQGSANVSLKLKDIEQVEVPNLNFDKQIALVKLIDKIQKRNIEIDGELEFQEVHLQQLRQAILQEAVQGKLTKQNEDDEPADKLLQRIKAEKQKLIAAGKLKKEKELPPITEDEIPFELPRGWVWCRLGEISLKITDGTHHSPINTFNEEFMYVTAKNIKDDGIILSNITFVSKEIHQEIYSRCNPEYGDVLFVKDGATTGIVTINNIKEPFSMLSSVALVKVPKEVINKYLVFVMRSPYYYQATRNNMAGIAITRVTLSKMTSTLIPLPPLSEQKSIVAKVEKLMLMAEHLQQQLQQSRDQVDQLLQASLKDVFSKKEKVYEKTYNIPVSAED